MMVTAEKAGSSLILTEDSECGSKVVFSWDHNPCSTHLTFLQDRVSSYHRLNLRHGSMQKEK